VNEDHVNVESNSLETRGYYLLLQDTYDLICNSSRLRYQTAPAETAEQLNRIFYAIRCCIHGHQWVYLRSWNET